MFRRKKETYSIREFMAGEHRKAKKISVGILAPLAVAPFLNAGNAMAAEAVPAAAMYDKMTHAFDPLITLVQALAYPVAMVVVLGGALFIMVGNREKSFSMMSGAGLGYVLVQMTPMVLDILVQAMKVI